MLTLQTISTNPEENPSESRDIPAESRDIPAINTAIPESSRDIPESRNLPAYVSRSGEQVYLQPYLARGVRAHCFVMQGEHSAIQRNICDRYLNAPSGGKTQFIPATCFFLLAFCNIGSLQSTASPFSHYGQYPEQEVALWVLTIDERREGPHWTFPYMWVDCSTAMASGREVYGFPKEWGWIEIPEDPQSLKPFTLDTMCLPTFNPQESARRERLIEVKRTGSEAPPPHQWGSFSEAAGDFLKVIQREDNVFADLRLLENIIATLISGTVPMVFLKQFRDAADGNRVCYQSIIESDTRFFDFKAGGTLADDYQVDIKPVASHPIRQDMGLPEGPLTPILSYWLEMDFELGAGQEIWRASV